jgi:glycerol-3-phosphate dehydrogenase
VTTSEAEIAYLLAAVNDVFPDAALRREDVTLHSAGVRPLPYVDRATPAAVTRRHWLESHSSGPVPLFSLVGGKLTTCRSLAEQTVATVLSRLGQRPFADSRDRRIPSVPCEGDVGNDVELLQRQFAERSGWSRAQIQAVWELCGSRAMTMLPAAPTAGPARAIEQANIPGTCLPRGFVRNLIRREWVTRLADLVERRLMLVYDQRLMVAALEALAELMVQEGRLGGESAAAEVRACRQRLESHYGRRVADGELK